MDRTIRLGADKVDRLATTVIDLGLHVTNIRRIPIGDRKNNRGSRLRRHLELGITEMNNMSAFL
jgi:hypothetical protein